MLSLKIIQTYASTSASEDNEVGEFLQELVEGLVKKTNKQTNKQTNKNSKEHVYRQKKSEEYGRKEKGK